LRKTTTTKKHEKPKFGKSEIGKKFRDSKNNAHFCKECGRNATHSTVDCFILKNRAKRAEGGAGDGKAHAKPFTKRTFRKEVNSMARMAGDKKMLSVYKSALKREEAKQANLDKKPAAKRKKDADSSDSEESMHNLEAKIPLKKDRKVHYDDQPNNKQRKEAKILAEEQAFLKKVAQAEKEDNNSSSETSEEE